MRTLGRHQAVVVIAVLALAVAAPRADHERAPLYGAVAGGASVLLPFEGGASPYSGIGRYEGRATCSAFFLATLVPGERQPHARAYAITAGHCPGAAAPGEPAIDAPGFGRVIFRDFIDRSLPVVSVPVARIAYAALEGRAIAILELDSTYDDLTRELIRPWTLTVAPHPRPANPLAIIGQPLSSRLEEDVLRLAVCRELQAHPVAVTDAGAWVDVDETDCRLGPGSDGAPVLSLVDRSVTGVAGPGPYVTPLAGLYACFDPAWHFTLLQPGCGLDRRLAPKATPAFIGRVNPLLIPAPFGAARPTWNVAVSGPGREYRYAVARPPETDCRTATYGPTREVIDTPLIDDPLPATEGVALLCIAGGSGEPVETATTTVGAIIDVTPPHAASHLRMVETDATWRVWFDPEGEITSYAFKAGPRATTRCDAPDGYAMAPPLLILEKGEEQVLCAVPYDGAQNAGPLIHKTLR